ncbi:FAD-dependent oxidoreductase [Sutterella sp.]|uniref:FAD-dependent oxidoreductase n=1 Tax=Sutterella sp. TaxID=1981025 RepID=UPI0026E027BA|nr:FAD-dependent oxidoreductase [Sutterella sp.]MDO5531942.1 FAD-dependent oxidoreductase [Sutterella sp.]
MKFKTLACVAALTSIGFMNCWAADQVINADVIVVGAGAGGTVAAVGAVEGGKKTVLLEKNAFPGGNGMFMEGSYAVGSSVQKAAGVKLTEEESFNTIMNYHHWKSNAPLVRRFVSESKYTIDWIQDHGVKFEEVTSMWPEKREAKDLTWHIYPGKHGSSLIKRMTEIFKEKGGTLLTQTPGKELLMKDGRVAGVVAYNKDGDKITINAPNVILATGGYLENDEMVKKYGAIPAEPNGALGHTGDGINMAFSAGAVPDGMGLIVYNGAFMPVKGEALCEGPNGQLRALFRQGFLNVNHVGDRFFNEEKTREWPFSSNAIQREGEVFVVFDADTAKELKTTGYLVQCGLYIRAGHPADKFDQLIAENEKVGNAFTGNTIEEVAKKAGMDPKKLAHAAKKMTEYTKKGHDDQFGKDPKFLRKVEKAPFYIVRGKLHALSSGNGVKVTEFMEVVDKNDRVIPGLFAIGHDAGGFYGDSYDLKAGEGSASAFAINGGRIAVKTILGEFDAERN